MPQSSLPAITIYTDGGCSPNPGPGGWAAILIRPDEKPQELTGSHIDATNNQMELQAAIEALKALENPHDIEFYTDSNYLRQGITEWLPKWERQNWQTSQKQPVKNQHYWEALAAAVKRHHINWHWTKGHAGDKWNERADKLASSMIPKPVLPLDDEQAIHLFTASSYSGKTKKGGWSILLRYRHAEKTMSGQVIETTSNRMHIQAAIEGLKAIKKPMSIHLYTTSSYLKDGATSWVSGWKANNWQTKQGKAVSHRDLWETLNNLTQQYPIKWHVVDKNDMPTQMEQAKRVAGEAAKA